jgi:tRNA-2-methylthio-N6-dimethylallyladenosine synthase
MGGIKKWKGRTNCNRIVHFKPIDDGIDYKWHWVDVKITSATALSTQADFIFDLGKKAPSLLQ